MRAVLTELASPGRIVLMAADGKDGISAEYGPAYAAIGAGENPGIKGWI